MSLFSKILNRPTPVSPHVRRTFLFLGREYVVELSPGPRNAIKIDEANAILHVSLHPMTRENFIAYFEGWYRRTARKEFDRAVAFWLPRLAALGHVIPPPQLKIFRMRRAWGRCYYTKGLITLNLHLAKAPREAISYILMHELCHFVVQNHSAQFKALETQLMPHWREVDQKLKTFAREWRIIT